MAAETVSNHLGVIVFLWGVLVFAFSGVVAYVSAVTGFRHAIKVHEAKFKEYDKRIEKLEEKAQKTVTFPDCRIEQLDCRTVQIFEINELKKKLDAIVNMFKELEERRSRRWQEYEIKREEQKDILNGNLLKITRQLICLEAAVQGRSHPLNNIFETEEG